MTLKRIAEQIRDNKSPGKSVKLPSVQLRISSADGFVPPRIKNRTISLPTKQSEQPSS